MKSIERINKMKMQGERLKEVTKLSSYEMRTIAQQYQLKTMSNIEVAAVLGLDIEKQSDKTVSAYYAGRIQIKEKYMQIIAAMRCVRFEYLHGDDDYRTFEEMENDVNTHGIVEYKAIVDYLSTLGFTAVPGVYFLALPCMFKYLSEKNMLSLLPLFVNESDAELFKTVYYSQHDDDSNDNGILFELKKNPFSELQKDVLKSATKDNMPVLFDNKAFFPVLICYKVSFNNSRPQLLELHKMQKLIKQIDAITAAALPGLFELIAEK